MIVPMKRLTLVALAAEQEPILKSLQAAGIVEIIERAEPSESAAAAAREIEIQRLKNAHAALRPYSEKEGMLSVKPEMGAEELVTRLPDAMELCERIESLERDMAALSGRADKCRAEIEQLLPFVNLTAPLEKVRPTESTEILAGLIETRVLPLLREACGDAVLTELSQQGKHTGVIIACHKSDAEQVFRALKELPFNEVQLANRTGTAAETIDALEREIKSLEDERELLREQLAELGARRKELAAGQDAAAIERDRAESAAELQKTAATFLLEGWVREDQLPELREAIESVTDCYYLETRDPAEEEEPPTAVKNNKFVEPYEAVVNLYSAPHYKGVDAAPLIAPFYFLFFGMMLSDTGYGIVLFLGCLLFRKLMKPTGMMRGIVEVLMWGGISTIICGFLLGTFFGLDFDVIFGTTGVFPLIFDPLENAMGMLYLCCGLGIFHMICGIVIKIVNCIKAGDWAAAIFDNFAWILIVLGAVSLIAVPSLSTVGAVIAVIGVVLVLFFAGRSRPNFGKRLVKGAGSLYDVTSYISDTLSYARIFALGMATGVMGSVFNTLASMLYSGKHGVMFVIFLVLAMVLLVALHAFSMVINVLGTFVHTARLQYIEYFGKFYESGGRAFQPLAYRTKNVRITK